MLPLYLISINAQVGDSTVEQRITAAANTGILDFKGCATKDAMVSAHDALQAVYVADLRSSRCVCL